MIIYCVIPAWNEEGSIANVIADAKRFVDRIVVVDDGSTDRTYQIAKQSGVEVIRHIINRGQGAALETGNRYAIKHNADIIIHFDADGQFLPSEIEDVIQPIKAGEADIVFGSRFLNKKSQIPWTKRVIIMPIARLVNITLFRAKLTDPQSGFRAFSTKTAKKIQIEQDDMAHCSEIIQKAFANKLRIKEVPITVIFKEYGSGFSSGIQIIKDHLLSKFIN